MNFLFSILSRLPLWLLHAIGAVVGFILSFGDQPVLRRNISLCLPSFSESAQRRVARAALISYVQAILEAPRLWTMPEASMKATLRAMNGVDLIDAARANGRGVIVATPHLGAWEMVGLEISRRYPMATLYKSQGEARDQLINAGRARFGAQLAPSTQGGVRMLLQALKRNEVVGILPDQDPPRGSGVFAPFFGIPAHTPVLLSRLVRRTGATVVFVFATRLAGGRGFELHCVPAPPGIADTDEAVAAAAVNRGVEQCVERCAGQYWWGYKRFRRRPEGEPKLYD